jgi:hypothetical protein
LFGFVLSASVALTALGCGDSNDGGSGGGAGAGGTAGIGGGSGEGGDGGSAAGSGGMGGSPDGCTTTVSDGVLTNLDGVQFSGNFGSGVEITTANFITLERNSGTTLFVFGEAQNQGSSLECALLMDLQIDGVDIGPILDAPAYENPFPGSSNWCLAPGEVGAFQAVENDVSPDLLENLSEVTFAIDALTYGDEVPHSAAPTIVSSDIEFSEDEEPFVSGVLGTDLVTPVFGSRLTFFLRNSCGLIVDAVGGPAGDLPANAELDFTTPPAITMQGTDVEDFLFFSSFSTR